MVGWGKGSFSSSDIGDMPQEGHGKVGRSAFIYCSTRADWAGIRNESSSLWVECLLYVEKTYSTHGLRMFTGGLRKQEKLHQHCCPSFQHRLPLLMADGRRYAID